MSHLPALLLCSMLMVAHEFSAIDKTNIIDLCLSDERVFPHVEKVYLDDSGLGYILLEQTDFVTKDLEKLLSPNSIRLTSKNDRLFKSGSTIHLSLKDEKLRHCEIEVTQPSTSFSVTLKLKKKTGQWYVMD